MAENQSGPFTPYVNRVNEKDPIREMVPVERTGIGANRASMPTMRDRPPGIRHVEDMNRK